MEERREKRGKSGYKLTASLDTETRNFVREISGSYINNRQLTIVWMGWKKAVRNLTASKWDVLLTLLLIGVL